MKILGLLLILTFAVCVAHTGGLAAQEKRPDVLLKGKITCARCELGLTKKCASVIVVKEGNKDAVYYFDAETNKKYHAEICSEGRPGEVVGTVATVDGKKIVTVSKLTFK